MLTDPVVLFGESRAEASVTGPLPAGARTAGDDGSALQSKLLRGARDGWRPCARARRADSITSARIQEFRRRHATQALEQIGRDGRAV